MITILDLFGEENLQISKSFIIKTFDKLIFFISFFSLGSNYYVRILSTIDRELLKPNASVALHKHSNALVDILPPEADSSIAMLQADEKPDVSYADIGGIFFYQNL